MAVGRTCPRHQELQILFPKSSDLQKAICLYFTVVVRLCKQTVLFIKKPFLSQLSYSIAKNFEAEFGAFKQELATLAAAVHDEVSLASKQIQVFEAQAQALERKEASTARQLATYFHSNLNLEIAEAKAWRRSLLVSRLLDACSTFDYRKAWKQARKLGSSEWIYKMNEYMSWRSHPETNKIWLHGSLGSGKTVVSANVVEDLAIVENSIISHFFCRFDDSESLKARTIFGSLIRQILEHVQSKIDSTNLQKGSSLDSDDLTRLLLQYWPQDSAVVFMLVDGIDECTDKEVTELLHLLRHVIYCRSDGALLKIFISSRQETYRWGSPLLGVEHVSMPKTNPEISLYIQSALEENLEAGLLTIQNPTLVLRISETLEKGAQGFFLWAAFQIQNICAQDCDRDILLALEDLPKDLPETFNRILLKLSLSDTSDKSRYKFLFDVLTVVFRPLSLAELREVLSIESGNITWDPSLLIHDIQGLVNSCGGLLSVDEEYGTVHFAHHSINTYLSKSETLGSWSHFHVAKGPAEVHFSQICLTYLNLDLFSSQVVKREKAPPPVTASPSQILATSMAHSKLNSSIALALLRYKMKTNATGELKIDRLLKRTHTNPEQSPFGAFKGYAEAYWDRHCLESFAVDARAVTDLTSKRSEASLFLRSVCKTKRFDLLEEDRHFFLDPEMDTLILLLHIAYKSEKKVPCHWERIPNSVSSDLLREFGIDVKSMRPFRSSPDDVFVVRYLSSREWTPISLAAALGNSNAAKSIMLFLEARHFAVDTNNPVSEHFRQEFVRAFREAACRNDREVMRTLVQGGSQLFRDYSWRLADRSLNDLLFYAVHAEEEDICLSLVDSPFLFDIAGEMYPTMPLTRRMVSLRAANMMQWLQYHVQFEIPKMFPLQPIDKPPTDCIKRTTDLYCYSEPASLRPALREKNNFAASVLGFQGSIVTFGPNNETIGSNSLSGNVDSLSYQPVAAGQVKWNN